MPGITDPTEAYFKDGQWGWDGTQWRKLTLVWGYSDRYAEKISNADCAAGTNALNFTAVSAGEVWVVNSICWTNLASACTIIGCQLVINATPYTATIENVPVAGKYYLVTPAMVMKAGDILRVTFYGCTLHDDIYAVALGYKMKVTE